MKNKIRDFKDLNVWMLSMGLVKKIYLSTKSFPKYEQYGLTSQIRRSTVSIPSNIAEGHERKGKNEYKHFISIALGSSAELETQLLLSVNLDYLEIETSKNILSDIKSIRMMLNKLYNVLNGSNIVD